MIFPAFTVQLPKWVNICIPDSKTIYSSIEERMELAVELAAQNIKHEGGPFGAAIFERETGREVFGSTAPGGRKQLPVAGPLYSERSYIVAAVY